MRTISHHPKSLYQEAPSFSYNIKSPASLTLPDNEVAFDYERCLESFIVAPNWRSFSYPEDRLKNGKISKREALFCFRVSTTPYFKRTNEQLRTNYPAKGYLNEPSDQDIQDALEEWCTHYAYFGDPYIIQVGALILMGSYSIEQTLKMYIPALVIEDRGEALMYLRKFDPDATRPYALELLEELNAKPGYPEHLKIQALYLISKQDELLSWFQGDARKDIRVRSWAMLAISQVDDWETFRQLAYEDHAEYYAPTVLRGHLEHFGDAHLELALEKIAQRWSSTWGCVFQIHHPSITQLALQIATNTQKLPLRHEALKWLHREGANAIVGALQLWEDAKLGHAAQDLLKTYIEQGHETLVLELAQTHAPQHIETLQAWAQVKPAPDAPLPAGCEALEYWFKRGMRHPIPDGISPHFPILTADGHPLSPAQIEGLLRLLQDYEHLRAMVDSQHLGAAISYDSRDLLAEHLLQDWFASGCLKRMQWCIEALPKLLPEGLERLHMSFREQLWAFAKDRQWTPWLKSRTQAYEAWRKFICVIAAHDSPTRLAICLHELSPPPFCDKWSNTWAGIQAFIHEHCLNPPTQALYEQFERAILTCQLTHEQREHLYYIGLLYFEEGQPLERWLKHKDELVDMGLRTRTLWRASSPNHDESLLFRVDVDGSLLTIDDEPLHLSDQGAIRALELTQVKHTSLAALAEAQRQAWEQTLSEHELILYQADPSWINILDAAQDSADFDDDDIPF